MTMATTTANHLHSSCTCPSVKGVDATRSTARNGAGVASMPHFFTHMTLALVLTVGGVKGTTTSESNQHHQNKHKIIQWC